MGDKKAYECKNCGKRMEVDSSESQIPECCDTSMEASGPLPVCDLSTTAEHSRVDDNFGEPCDDGRSGKL